MCNWEWLLLAAGAHLAIPIDVVYKPLRLADVDTYVRDARRRFGANPIPHKSFLYEVMRRDDEPRAYAMLADQTPLKRTPKHWIRFLNRDTAFFLGPERIARYLDATVVYVAMTRVRRGYYEVRLEVIAEPPYGEERGSRSRRPTRAASRRRSALRRRTGCGSTTSGNTRSLPTHRMTHARLARARAARRA